MGYPDFVCMGFQKCGTTTLYDIFRQHPQVALCRDVKEPMYYRAPVFEYLGLGHRYYKSRYFGHLNARDRRLKGEINAGLTYGGCARRVKHYYPKDVKMIFMMRNPIDRSYSAYKYFLARGFLPKAAVLYDDAHGHAQGFDHYVHFVIDNPKQRSKIMKTRQRYMVLSQSNYASCLRDYLDTFDVSQMHFMIFEEFIQDQHESCRELYRFLGVTDAPGIAYDIRANEGNERVVSPFRARQYLVDKSLNYAFYDLAAMPHWIPKVYDAFEKHHMRVRNKCLKLDEDKSKVLPETRQYLEEYFEPEVREMEKLIGRNLHTVWNFTNV